MLQGPRGNLVRYRKRAGLTQVALAAKCRCARSTIFMLESDRRRGTRMNVALLKRLAKVLKVSVDALVK